MNKFALKEEELSQKLRGFCDEKGRELWHEESGKVLNELGLLYKDKSPDKISLIQSAALLNAAIVRQPSNAKFHEDLKTLCNRVLQCAIASQKDANLLEISKQVKKMVANMREETDWRLENIKPIRKGKSVVQARIKFQNKTSNLVWKNQKQRERIKIKCVKTMQDRIAQKYTEMMTFISCRCIEIMGTPPCKYSLVGMGSLARKEITPYSDFEHIIVLEELLQHQNRERILEYFRWYSVIFHVIVINLQETIIPSVWIRSLNDKSKQNGNWFFDKITPRGISFDGMMPHACKFPLGRTYKTPKKPWTTELIKPVSEMAKYLEVEEDLKNGYHLADILTKTCFVEGDKDVYKNFCDTVNEKLKKQSDGMHQQVLKQLKDDLQNFNIGKRLGRNKTEKSFNIKRVIYRSVTLFISALGQLTKCFNENTNFAILEELHQKHIINDNAYHDLSFAVAIACHIRLFQYMKKKSQEDLIGEFSQDFFRSEKFKFFLSVVSKEEFAKFFSTVLRLQTLLLEKDTSNADMYFDRSTVWPELLTKIFMGLYDEAINEGESYFKVKQDINDMNDAVTAIYAAKAYYAKGNLLKYGYWLNRFQTSNFRRYNFFSKKDSFASLLPKQIPHSAFHSQFNPLADEMWYYLWSPAQQSKYSQLTRDFMHVNGQVRFLIALESYQEALSLLRDYLHISKPGTQQVLFRSRSRKGIFMLFFVSACLMKTGRPKQALHIAFESLELLDQCGILGLHFIFSRVIAECYCKLDYTKQTLHYTNISQSQFEIIDPNQCAANERSELHLDFADFPKEEPSC